MIRNALRLKVPRISDFNFKLNNSEDKARGH